MTEEEKYNDCNLWVSYTKDNRIAFTFSSANKEVEALLTVEASKQLIENIRQTIKRLEEKNNGR
jgi:hypothetical protein